MTNKRTIVLGEGTSTHCFVTIFYVSVNGGSFCTNNIQISRNINKSLAQVFSDFTKYIYESAGQLNNYDN